MTQPTAEQLEVTQADRDAAAASYFGFLASIRGEEDGISLARSFARHRQATEARMSAAVEAAQAFVDRLKFIHEHPAYKSVWMVNQAHCGPYDGPQYSDELEALETALAKIRSQSNA